MELRAARVGARLALVVLAVLLVVPASAGAADLKQPKQFYTPPPGYGLSAQRVLKIADRTQALYRELLEGRSRP